MLGRDEQLIVVKTQDYVRVKNKIVVIVDKLVVDITLASINLITRSHEH